MSGVPGKRYEDWELTDPAGKGIEEVRAIRDDIKRRVSALLGSLLPASASVEPARYRHFKGGEYEVVLVAKDVETEEPVVVYQALYGERGTGCGRSRTSRHGCRGTGTRGRGSCG